MKGWIVLNWDNKQGDLKNMMETNWFDQTTRNGDCCVWTPAPAAADVAGEMMAGVIHQQPNTLHLFIVPQLMTSRWQRRVGQLYDFEFKLEAGGKAWNLAQHEPLLIFVCLPLSVHRPWKLRGTKLLDQMDRKMRELQPSDHQK